MNSIAPLERLAHYPLLEALIERRSRRFGSGISINGGPLAYDSTRGPQPLSLEEEAAPAFAACGITGQALAELPYESGEAPEAGGGNIMTHFVGRTVASGDAMHDVILFVVNDEGGVDAEAPTGLSPTRDSPAVPSRQRAAGIPPYSDEAIAAMIAYCEYVYERYGRFPANSGPFRTVLAPQSHHLDPDFYGRFYRHETLSETQREHPSRWHNHEG